MIHDVDVTCFELGLWCSMPLSTVFQLYRYQQDLLDVCITEIYSS